MEERFSYEHPAHERAHELFMAVPWTSEAAYWTLPLRERYLVDIMNFEKSVLNGGIKAYIQGPSANHALQCLEALQAIGATEAPLFLQSTCNLFPECRPSSDQEERGKQVDQIVGERRNLDELVVDGGFEYELWELFLRYWDAHNPDA